MVEQENVYLLIFFAVLENVSSREDIFLYCQEYQEIDIF